MRRLCLQRFVGIQIALDNLVLKAVNDQPCLDAPVAGLGRYPGHATHGFTLGWDVYVYCAHGLKEQPDAKTGHTELEGCGVGIGGSGWTESAS